MRERNDDMGIKSVMQQVHAVHPEIPIENLSELSIEDLLALLPSVENPDQIFIIARELRSVVSDMQPHRRKAPRPR